MPPVAFGPTGSCAPNGEMTLRQTSPDGTATLETQCQFTWDGVSVKPNCDGQVTLLHTRNTGTAPAWAMLPNKKKAPLWVKIDPGTDVSVTSPGQLNNLGLANAVDVRGVVIQFTDPAA